MTKTLSQVDESLSEDSMTTVTSNLPSSGRVFGSPKGNQAVEEEMCESISQKTENSKSD